MEDIRRDAARYYDVGTTRTNDIDFYVKHIPSEDPTILELGCGTGRVLIPLSRHCDSIVGVDNSGSMLDLCKEKLQEGQASTGNIALLLEDITSLNLQRLFGLIIAPFRVFQNIDTDENVKAFFRSIHRHLSPHGSCILNVFKPNTPARELVETWEDRDEVFSWEKPLDSGLLKHYYKRKMIKKEPLGLYPELIYRYYENENLVEEVSFVVPMRVYYPDEFKELIQNHRFDVVETWGGYSGEKYGEGPELVVKFRKKTGQQGIGA
jgi:ubiquinone/menaquinone biosynthesis C-methylase UbiE